MNDQSLKENIETGQYFIEARTWYNSVFLLPIRHNALLFGISLSITMVLFFVCYSIYNIFPLTQTVQIVMQLDDTIDLYPKIRDLSEPNKSTKEVVLEYLVTKYLTNREIYDPLTFKENYYFVVRSTDKNIFNDYYTHISDPGPQGTLALYKDGFRSKINIVSRTYDLDNNIITVNFTKQIYNIITGESGLNQYEAKVKFLISDYDFSQSVNTRLNFVVTNYEITEIKN